MFEHISVSLSSDLTLLGPIEVSLLRSDPGSVCRRGRRGMQLHSWSTRGRIEGRQSRAVEDPQRISTLTGSVPVPSPLCPVVMFLFGSENQRMGHVS